MGLAPEVIGRGYDKRQGAAVPVRLTVKLALRAPLSERVPKKAERASEKITGDRQPTLSEVS
jgi:hypothetical protein